MTRVGVRVRPYWRKRTAEDMLTDLTGQQIQRIRRRTLAAIKPIEAGEFNE